LLSLSIFSSHLCIIQQLSNAHPPVLGLPSGFVSGFCWSSIILFFFSSYLKSHGAVVLLEKCSTKQVVHHSVCFCLCIHVLDLCSSSERFHEAFVFLSLAYLSSRGVPNCSSSFSKHVSFVWVLAGDGPGVNCALGRLHVPRIWIRLDKLGSLFCLLVNPSAVMNMCVQVSLLWWLMFFCFDG
jgi:hypothetical protein